MKAMKKEAEHDQQEYKELHNMNHLPKEEKKGEEDLLDHQWVIDKFKFEENLFLPNKPEIKKELMEMLRHHGDALTRVGGSFKPE